VNPPDGLGAYIRLGRWSKSLQTGLLLWRVVDELDPCVGSELLEEMVVDGIIGVENYSIVPLCIIDP
jgi:hypothetical protein